MGNIKKDKKRKKTFIVIISNSSSRVDHYLRGRELGLLLSLHPISDCLFGSFWTYKSRKRCAALNTERQIIPRSTFSQFVFFFSHLGNKIRSYKTL
jgi:hypothetical protein